jgi:hypothetical protein
VQGHRFGQCRQAPISHASACMEGRPLPLY